MRIVAARVEQDGDVPALWARLDDGDEVLLFKDMSAEAMALEVINLTIDEALALRRRRTTDG